MDEHLKQTKAFFDSMAEKWDTFCYHDPAKLAAIVTLSGFAENAKIADIACEAAAKKFNDGRIKLWQGDFNEFAKKDFDCAFVYSAYPHFPDKAAFAEKIHSVLKPDGRFVIAHSKSRHEINHRHSQGAEHVSDILAPVSEERVYFDKLFDIDITVDTDYMYIISGTKKC